MKQSLFALLFSLISLNITTAQSDYCGTPKGDTDLSHNPFHLYFVDAYHHQGLDFRSATVLNIPVVLHLVGNDDGTIRFPITEALDRLCDLNQQYLPYDIHFFLKNLQLDNSSDGNSGSSGFQAGDLEGFKDPSALNLFITSSSMSGTRSVCGYYSGGAIWGAPGFPDLIDISGGCSEKGNTTWAHEIGHYLSLPHTFFGWEGHNANSLGPAPSWAEKVDRSNCTTAGDGICDTYPDYLWDRWSCGGGGRSFTRMSLPSGTVDLIDVTGDTFRVDGTNFMSYANDNCMNKFTTEQSAKIRAYIQNQRSVLLTQPTPPVYPDITDSVQIIGPMHGDSVQDYSNVTLRWHRVPNATHYGVEVWFSNPFGSSYKTVETAFTTDTSYHCTNVLPHRYYYWKIKAINPHTTCSPISPKLKFRTGYGALAVNTLDIYHLDGAVFPNPNHENNFTVDINTLKATKGNLQVIGLDGKVFYSEDIRLQTGENQFNVENIYLPNGIFLVRVQTEDGSFWQEKLSIIK